MIQPLAILALVLLGYMHFWFILSIVKKRNDVADVAWGLGFVVLAWVSYFISDQPSFLGLVVSSMVSLWGARLALHIWHRNKGKGEDYRYQAWRNQWGRWFYLRSYLQVYLLQGVLLFMVSIPVIFINMSGGDFVATAFIGLLVWCVGFFFEAVGDWQLKAFLKNPANQGHLINTGLWAYTRHPNYFGEVTMWWGIWLMSLHAFNPLVTIIGPITITFLILKVSGIPMLEKKMAEHPDFASYKKSVSAFFPLPPRKTK